MLMTSRAIASLVLSAAVGSAAACGSPSSSASEPSPTAAVAPASDSDDDVDHGHEHTAPHGGTLIELGEEFAHVELVLDSAAGRLTAYVLDGEAESAVRIADAELRFTLQPPAVGPLDVVLAAVPNPLSGETVGDTSQFAATVPALRGVEEFFGSLHGVTVRGQAFSDLVFSVPGEGHGHDQE